MFLAAIFVTIVFLIYAAYPGRCDRWFDRHYQNLLLALIVGLAGMLLVFARYDLFILDEILHVHIAWYIEQGFRPGVDFFSEFHPLFHHMVQPFLALFGHTTTTIIALRMFMFCHAVCVVFMVYLIVGKVAPAREVRLLSLVALLSQTVFLHKIVEIRPDAPMTLFALVAIYFLLTFLQTAQKRHIIACGLSAAIAFLFLQKAVFVLAALALVFGWRLLQRKMTIASLLYFGLGFAPPVLAFLGYLVASGSFHDYWVTNWLIFVECDIPERTWEPLRLLDIELHMLPQCLAILLFSIIAPVVMLVRRDSTAETKVVAFIGLFVLLVVTGSIRWLYGQYLLPSVALFSISIAQLLTVCFERLDWRPLFRLALVGLVFVLPMVLLEQTYFASNRENLEKIEYVLQNTTESDAVYDGGGIYNVFRPDLHYIWYHSERSETTAWLNQHRKLKFEDYDIYRLIETKRPKFISSYALDITQHGLSDKYQEVTRHSYRKQLYIRRDQ